MARALTLADKLQILFEYGEARGISPAYRAIAEATGENATNIRKIHKGENINPGLKILRALVKYFGVGLSYFDYDTRAECEAYLAQFAPARAADEIKLRANGMSEEGLTAVRNMLDFVRKAEGLGPPKPPEK
jgi:transcriptional regulator with XRE-family HTH domain